MPPVAAVGAAVIAGSFAKTAAVAVVGKIALGAVAKAVIVGAVVGAAAGAASSAISGGDIKKGAITGAVIGGTLSGVSSAVGKDVFGVGGSSGGEAVAQEAVASPSSTDWIGGQSSAGGDPLTTVASQPPPTGGVSGLAEATQPVAKESVSNGLVKAIEENTTTSKLIGHTLAGVGQWMSGKEQAEASRDIMREQLDAQKITPSGRSDMPTYRKAVGPMSEFLQDEPEQPTFTQAPSWTS